MSATSELAPILSRDPRALPEEFSRGADIPENLDPLADGVLMRHQAEWLEDDSTLKMLSGSPPQELQISKDSIDDRAASPVSIMPVGLLNTLDKEQILDLLAFLLANGDADSGAVQQHHHQ